MFQNFLHALYGLPGGWIIQSTVAIGEKFFVSQSGGLVAGDNSVGVVGSDSAMSSNSGESLSAGDERSIKVVKHGALRSNSRSSFKASRYE